MATDSLFKEDEVAFEGWTHKPQNRNSLGRGSHGAAGPLQQSSTESSEVAPECVGDFQ